MKRVELINYKKISNHLRKGRYNGLLYSENIISWGLNVIEECEEEVAHKWWTNHSCFKNKEFLKQDIELWSPYPHVKFQRTSIANTIKIICPVCDEEKDVTDYEGWPY